MQEHPLDHARRWLAQATADSESAAMACDQERYDLSLFMCQQTAEKLVKAVLIWRSGDYQRTHLIGDLVEELRRVDVPLADALTELRALDNYYLPTRYPDALGGAVPALTFQREETDLARDRVARGLRVVERLLAEAGA